ncbi:uncharacterized protein LOC124168902 [Ischnura elegans]|uniref:uncharacterized protein LOC124168902 n=1 Tax=Ischnura elegans TaxID=197161 RepID=UPI001ED8BE81|nr:uncharacterized protein LOC124168902 [Ischnura elegans]
MKVRSGSESGDSNDIDLDEILKTIDPLDDIDKRLFSADPATSPPRTAPIASKQKDPVYKERLRNKDDDDDEVLTSLSSNNDQGKSEGLGQSLSKSLGNFDVGGGYNAPARARRRNAKFGAGSDENTSTPMVGANIPSSNVETGLWSGDDLWKLGGDQVSEQPMASVLPPSKSSTEESRMKIDPKQATGSGIKGDKKPGKYDWLGLLDDESDEEKDRNIGLRDQKPSTSVTFSVGKEVNSSGRSKNENLSLSGIDNDPSKVLMGSSRKPMESSLSGNIITAVEPQGISSKNSLSENISSPKHSSKSSGEPRSRRLGLPPKDELKSTQTPQAFKNNFTDSFGQSKEVRDKSKGAAKDIKGKEELSKASGFSQSKSFMEEEEKSPRSYTPSFLDGSPVKPGRRRRNREGTEGMPSRANINVDFDPLDLFSIDDGPSKTDSSKSKKELPDWLTGSSKIKSPGKVNEDMIEISKEEAIKGKELDKNVESLKDMAAEKLEDVEPYSPRHSAQKLSQPEEKDQDPTHTNVTSTEVGPEKLIGKTLNEKHMPSTTGHTQVHDSESTSRGASDESPKKIPQKSLRKSRKEEADYKLISGLDKLPIEDAEGSPMRRKTKKDDEKSSKKHHHKLPSVVEKKPKPNKNDISEGRTTDEEVGSTSLSEKSDTKSYYSKQLASLERKYRRKEKEANEKTIIIEQMEEDLRRMRFFEGEVEHLKAVVHVLEMEKSAVEDLVESLQARHGEQLKRLEDVHRNEVETLRKAVIREEKRGAEEVKRLVEDHKKTLDRLMDANVKLEEEFRTRMLEARRDWGRDVEAMRVAYQQSNNAAITNASLAVLTGHSFGSDTKEKGEDDTKGDSWMNTQSKCLEEVKELSQKVERMETILARGLELMMPKAKPQSGEVPVHEREEKARDADVVVNNVKKGGRVAVSTKGRQRHRRTMVLAKTRKINVGKDKKLDQESGSSEDVKVSFEKSNHDVYSSDEEGDGEEMVRSETGFKLRRQAPKKEVVKKRKDGCCRECKCCHESSKKSVGHTCRSMSTQETHYHWDKTEKDGQNVNSRDADVNSRDGGPYWRNRDRMSSLKDQLDSRNNFRNDKEERLFHKPASGHVSLDYHELDTFFSHVARSVNVIVDPKEYLVRLAATYDNDLFQPSLFAPNI